MALVRPLDVWRQIRASSSSFRLRALRRTRHRHVDDCL